jgi:hypothetical protein
MIPDPRLPASPSREWPRPYSRTSTNDAPRDLPVDVPTVPSRRRMRVRYTCPRAGQLVECLVCHRTVPHRVETLDLEGALLKCPDGEVMVREP